MGPNEIILLKAISLLDTEKTIHINTQTHTHTVGVYIHLYTYCILLSGENNYHLKAKDCFKHVTC